MNTPDCIVSTATAKAAKGGNADSNACVNTPSCGNADATAKARGGNADVTVLALETGKAHAGHGGTAIVTPTGVSCTTHAHAKLIDAAGVKHRC